MRSVEAAANTRSSIGRDVRGEGQLMRLLVQLEHGACLPCFRRLSGVPPERLDATLETLRTQVMIYADEERCPRCRRPGHVIRLFDVPASPAFAASE
jgi:hypothetical protein